MNACLGRPEVGQTIVFCRLSSRRALQRAPRRGMTDHEKRWSVLPSTHGNASAGIVRVQATLLIVNARLQQVADGGGTAQK